MSCQTQASLLSIDKTKPWRRSACKNANPTHAVCKNANRSVRGNLNTIHCGDFIDRAKLLGKHRFDLVIADPPYNIGKDFGNNLDKRSLKDYIDWTREWLSVCMKHLSDQGVIYVYGFPEILAHIAVKYPMHQQRWLVWHYTNKTVPGFKFWQRSHESILCLWKKNRPVINVDAVREEYTETFLRNAAGKIRKETYCRYSTRGKKTIYQAHPKGALPRDVLKVPALAGGAGRSERWFMCRDCGGQVYPPEQLAEHKGHDVLKHPTQKPMKLTRRLLLSAINGSGVLIPFAGSGSECVVAKQLGADFFAAEINDEYVAFGQKWLELTQQSE